MLKLILISCVLIHYTNAFPFLSGWFGTSETEWTNMTEMIKRNKYPCQEHVVLTTDGYLLDLVRMRSNRTAHDGKKMFDEALIHSWSSAENMYKASRSEEATFDNDDTDNLHFRATKPAVLLMPSILTSPEIFIIGGPSQGLAYKLADEGFDVFIGSYRGSSYGSKHTVLKSDRDSLFWKFGLYELATRDLPSVIDYILRVTQVKSIKYVGHMEGSTLMYILLSEDALFNNKISSMISLGPVGMMKHSDNSILNDVAQHLSHTGWLIKNIGIDKFTPSQELMQESEHKCTEINTDSTKMCQDISVLLNGYNFQNINKTTMNTLLHTRQGFTSSKVIKNFAQFISTGRFGKCLTEEDTCNLMRDYNLNGITVPISMIYTSNDSLSSVQDVRKMIEKLSTVRNDINVPNYSNNMELLLGNNVSSIVMPIIIKGLQDHNMS